MFAFTSADLVHDGITVLTLIVLEGLLSADNALVLAVMVRHLPLEERGRALKYGIFGAFFFRAIGVMLAGFLIRIWYLKAIGALYLLYLSGDHFWKKFKSASEDESAEPKKKMSFWQTVVAVELTDIAFSLDSIVAAVAMAPDKPWIVYLGGVLGIITMRFVAGYFLKLLDAFHALETSAYLLVAWIGLKLGLETYVQVATGNDKHVEGPIPKWLFWTVMGVLFFGAFLFKKKPDAELKSDSEAAAAVDAAASGVTQAVVVEDQKTPQP